jgi:phospholipid/cholesterol/gamma-HCH transport system ATP-binding protein
MGSRATALSRPAWSNRRRDAPCSELKSTAFEGPERLINPTQESSEPLIDVQDVHYAIGTHAVFSGLTLRAAAGSITAIMGPSGTGKTTLLRLIMGQIQPQSGRISVFGQEVASLKRPQLYALRQRVGMLFQNGALLTGMSVFENVAFPVREHARLPEPVLRELVLMKLQAVGLRGAAELSPAELSGGMARRVALARAIVMDPEVLLYDEPFVGLDPISKGVILRLIQSLNRALHITSILVSHDVQEISAIADRTYLLSGGKVVAEGSPAELKSAASDVVQQFMSGAPDGPVPFHYPAPDYHEQLLQR